MYEQTTYESLLQRMLDKIPSSIDKREGSIIYDALAPCALELGILYMELDVVLTETFGDTASREYLERRAYERGIIPKSASKAVLSVEFDAYVDIGERFSLGTLNYVVIDNENGYKIECETEGVDGNINYGTLIPINYIEGLTVANLLEILIPGEDPEDTEEFRVRYFESFETKSYGGNVADYISKTTSIAGVGSVKVTPIWNGGGTVKLTILNSDYDKASETLITVVQEEIDPTGDGLGVGVAPIGHIVTVDTATEFEIGVSTKIVFKTDEDFEGNKEEIQRVVDEYFGELRKTWADEESLIVRISQIETRIMNISTVLDISDTKLNGKQSNIEVVGNDIPVLKVVEND